MFNNIGKKIKSLAALFTWIGIAGSVIGGVSIIGIDSELTPIGIIVIVVGSVLSWVASFLLYGFGELVDNSTKIAISIEKSKNPTAVPDKIATLRKWREQGLISEEDYQKKVMEIE